MSLLIDPFAWETTKRADIVREANEWISTPYHDHGTIKGRAGGVDCAMLVKEVFERTGAIAPFTVPHYSPQHFLHSAREWYIEIILTFAREIAQAETKPGDVVTFKLGRSHGHGGIIVDPGWPTIIHAWSAASCVVRGSGLQETLGGRERRFFSAFPRL